MDEDRGSTVELSGASRAKSGANARLSIATNMSPDYLRSAALFARYAHELELTGLAAHKAGEDFDSEPYRAFSASSVAFAAFFIEAALYEFLTITLGQPDVFDTSLSEPVAQAISEYWERTRSERRITIVDRYNHVLSLASKDILDKNASPVTDVKTLVDFRNALFHYTPEWEQDQGSTRKVVGGLRVKVKAINPFHPTNGSEFPKRYISHGCAEWAVGSVFDFYNLFINQIGLKQRYDRTDPTLATRVDSTSR